MTAEAITFRDWLDSVHALYTPHVNFLVDTVEACEEAGLDTEAARQVVDQMREALREGDVAELDRLANQVADLLIYQDGFQTVADHVTALIGECP